MSHDPVQAKLDELLGLVRQMSESFARMEHQLRDAKREALHQRTRTLPSPQGLTIGPLQPYGTPGTVASGTTVTATTAASRAHAHDRPHFCDTKALCAAAGCQAPQDNEP